MKTCEICGDKIPDSAKYAELTDDTPVCMDCFNLFFAADDEPQGEPMTETKGGAA